MLNSLATVTTEFKTWGDASQKVADLDSVKHWKQCLKPWSLRL